MFCYNFNAFQAVTELQCSWYGFYEAQSKIVTYRFAIGSQEGYDDVYPFTDVAPSMDRHMASGEWRIPTSVLLLQRSAIIIRR